MDNERLTELCQCVEAVHKVPVNTYQHFIKAFVYIYETLGLQNAVKKAQAFWKSESKRKKAGIMKGNNLFLQEEKSTCSCRLRYQRFQHNLSRGKEGVQKSICFVQL